MATVSASARHRLARLLEDIGVEGDFSARETAPVDDLCLEVRGVGRLALPVPDDQASQLCRIGRPARYGQGDKTLLDPAVRNTWEIPRSRVKIDQRQWNRTLLPVVDRLRRDLGLPDGCQLRAELHSMLVYGPGQFFVPHQDSEKADDMVGSLVMTVPSVFTGGSLLVEHRGEVTTYRSSKTLLSFVAFYADCRHEIRPVTSGHRIVLTYNLHLRGTAAGPTTTAAPPATVEAVARCLDEHFTTPIEAPQWRHDVSPTEPPNRLVYLLDYEYTQRGLSWARLKGDDAGRAPVVQAAAAHADCDVVLALADVHEVWSCSEPDWGRPHYGSRRRSYRSSSFGDDQYGLDDYDLEELIDWSVTLDHWIPASDGPAEPIVTIVGDHEVCESTPSVGLQPYSSEYEGYMGNYGNTMDRWYHRGALVLWPRSRSFAVRAEAAPRSALNELLSDARGGNLGGAREKAATLAPFWASAASGEHTASFFTAALRVAQALDDPELASMLLAPFSLVQLAPTHAKTLIALDRSYGSAFTSQLITTWSSQPLRGSRATSRPEWIATLDRLCDRLSATGNALARLLTQDAWAWLQAAISRHRILNPPSRRNEALEELGPAVTAVLHSTAIVDDGDLRNEIISALDEDSDDLLPCLTRTLRAASSLEPATRTAAGLDHIARHCAARLRTRLSRPARANGDWSIAVPTGWHNCPLCETLAGFLTDPTRKTMDWPLAEDKRRHIHSMIDTTELPVHHQTRRTGRPYTLVLTKTDALLEQEQRERHRDTTYLVAIEALLEGRTALP